MAKDLNKVMVIGRLGADPEMRYTPQGAAVTTFSVASGRKYTTAAGEEHEETEWFNMVAWNKLGEICNQYLTKGSRVYIEGRVKTEKWQDKDTGENRYRTTYIVGEMIILDGRNQGAYNADENDDEENAPKARQEAPRSAPARQPATQSPQRQNVPQNGTQHGTARPSGTAASAYNRNARNVPQVIDDDDSDLPF